MAYYERYVLLPPGLDLPFESLAGLIEERFRNDESVRIKRFAKPEGRSAHLELRCGEWTLWIGLNTGPHVIEESRWIVEQCGQGRPDKDELAACDRRIEIGGDDDLYFDHINEFIFVLEVVETLEGVTLFDPHEGSLRSKGEFQ